jgi:hypothetical protein
MARLNKLEKEAVYRAICIYDETGAKETDMTSDEIKALETARLKMRMELYRF